MYAQPLALTPMRTAEANVRNRLAAGLYLPFSRQDQPGEIHVSLAADGDNAPLSYWRCDCGIFALSTPSPVLGLLSDCPLLPVAETPAEQQWYWTLYNQSLAPSVSAVLGHIHPQPDADTGEALLKGWVAVSWNGLRTRSLIQASTTVWLALLSQSGWQATYLPLPDSLSFTVPLILADAVLTPEALRPLHTGDLILPTHPYFSPDGLGSITLPPWRIQGTVQLEGLAPYHFVISDMENVPMNESFDDMQEYEVNSEGDNVTNNSLSESVNRPHTASLPPLPVTLNIRCGQITFTLPELQRLTSGAVLTLRDVVPGEAWLCHGDIPLAHGELIDVEGKLGLQITRMLSSPEAPAEPEFGV
ncbi:hypothetical protein BIY29_07320 [Brenneria alni]|uniref:Flagellar motor switch protein FliN-like C-terminal domain-containing protein n=1 Tax=Brenneria alni TaxID=71656 RepID=A0A421DQ93_9GAMM|nr:type III secretion system cytoplasmic ring protein SctQ [Brenneria alni]RLM25314.1 hypothetical protein BIY29_07320 [Brenneria alni]